MASPAARSEFDPGRISPGETIAGASGLLLFVFLFLHWFAGGSAWQFFDIVDVLLAVIGLLALAIAGAKAMGSPLFGDNVGLMLAFLGTVASSITLTFVLEGDQRRLGLWLSFAAALGLLYGGWKRMHEAPGVQGPLAGVMSGVGGGGVGSNEPTTPMTAGGGAGVPGGGAAGVSPGKEGPGVPHPGTSTGGPTDAGGAPRAASPGADPVPGSTSAQTPPGLAGEPPRGEGTHPPGL